jgi:hypothetical protein
MEQLKLLMFPESQPKLIAHFLTIIGVDSTFLAVRAAIRQIVLCFSYYQPRRPTILSN